MPVKYTDPTPDAHIDITEGLPTFEDDDMPAEFADDPTVVVPFTPAATASGSSYNSGSMSLEEMDAKGFNDQRDELERAKMNPPTGDWKKETSWDFSKNVNSNDQAPGDLDPEGRTFFNFNGKPEPREANGLQYEPSLRLRISPDRRTKADKPEIDTAYKLYLKAKDIYLEKYSEKGTYSKLCHFLSHDAFVLRTMQGDNGPIVVDLKLKTFSGGGNRRS
jgi:hypothetical protein